MALNVSLKQAVHRISALSVPHTSDTTAESSEAFCRRHDDSRLHLKSAVYSVNMKGDRTFPCGAAEVLTSCSGTRRHSYRNQDLSGSQELLLCYWTCGVKTTVMQTE